MRLRLFLKTFVFALLVLFGGSASGADLCGARDVAPSVEVAATVFSGEIIKVERVQTSTRASDDYFVTFRVETWWKGTPSREARVLWRSSAMNCPFFPVGEVGESYLVYADAPGNNSAREQIPEVTIFNRTSRLPANPEAENLEIMSRAKQPLISPNPSINRADASSDVKLLIVLRKCGCLSLSQLPPLFDPQRPTSTSANSREMEGVSGCQTCLRNKLKLP